MATLRSYTFHNTDRIGADVTDQSQRNSANTSAANYMLADSFSKNISNSHVNFAVKQPSVNFSAIANGAGLNGGVVDNESNLMLKTEQQRPLEKLQLFSRPFATVPYLGRGSCDPSVESRLLQGEWASDRKSVSTIMDKSFSAYSLYPTDNQMEERVKDATHTVEEAALEGWVRGGAPTRELNTENK